LNWGDKLQCPLLQETACGDAIGWYDPGEPEEILRSLGCRSGALEPDVAGHGGPEFRSKCNAIESILTWLAMEERSKSCLTLHIFI